MNSAIRCTLVVLAGVLCAATTAVASADEIPRQVVRFGDLDLSRDSGTAALYGRIRMAAREICESASNGGMGSFAAKRRCTQQAVARALDSVNSAVLKTSIVAEK